MTATPIPRTLALLGFGDLDVTALRELPPGRQPIATHVVAGERERARAYERIREELRAGRQAFVVCPLVEESEALQAAPRRPSSSGCATASSRLPRRAAARPDAPAREGSGRWRAFAAGEADVLVATTVIEVGIDVPNATVMLVEDAERYGISQLHQLRGRVGRGAHESLCLLFGPKESARLRGAGRARRRLPARRDRPRAARRGRADRHAPVRAGRFRFARLPEDAELLERARARGARAARRRPRAERARARRCSRDALRERHGETSGSRSPRADADRRRALRRAGASPRRRARHAPDRATASARRCSRCSATARRRARPRPLRRLGRARASRRSRAGRASALFVERDAARRDVVRANLDALGRRRGGQVRPRRRPRAALRDARERGADIRSGLPRPAIPAARRRSGRRARERCSRRCCARDARVVTESDRRAPLDAACPSRTSAATATP